MNGKIAIALCAVQLATGCVTVQAKPWVPQYARTQVSLSETRSADTHRVRVQGASGPAMEELQTVARVDAVVFAARSMAGERLAQDRAEQAVLRDPSSYSSLATPVQQLATRLAPDGQNMSGDVLVDVNVGRLRSQLEQAGALVAERALSKSMANPRILVLPNGLKPGETLPAFAKVVTDAIASHLVRKGWELVDSKAVEEARARVMRLDAAAGGGVDPVAAVALEAGAEIYVTWAVTVEGDANAGLNAYETASGRLLSSATGRSKRYVGGSASETTRVEEAVSNAIPELVQNVTAKWTEALSEGRRVSIHLSGDFKTGDLKRRVKAALKRVGTFDESGRSKDSMVGVLLTNVSHSDFEDELESALKEQEVQQIDQTMTSKVLVRWNVGMQ